jgi:diguanylate cyclase (GGDEF)-like protein
MKSRVNTSNLLPPINDLGDKTTWLNGLDVTKHDYPYIDSLLKNSFTFWKQQAHELYQLEGARWYIANFATEIIHDGSYEPLIKKDMRLVRELVKRCIEERTSVTVNTEHASWIAVPITTRVANEPFAALVCFWEIKLEGLSPEFIVNIGAQHFQSCFYTNFENLFVADLLQYEKQARRDENRRAVLFKIVQNLHDKIDVDSVLTETFERVEELFPSASIELFMSQDHPSDDPRVKSLLLQGESNSLCVRAYTEGEILQQPLADNNQGAKMEVAIPFVGKQGIYGVFHMIECCELFEELDVQLMSMLIDTAGIAFENAKLYEQSNALVDELRLINEVTKRFNQSLQLDEVFKYATDELMSIFKAKFCCITQVDKTKNIMEVMSCNVPSIENNIFPVDYGYSGQVHLTREAIILYDYASYNQITSKLMEETNSRSLIAAPLITRGEVNGVVMLSHPEENFFSYDNFKLLQLLASHIGLAVANASLHAEVQRIANQDMLTGLFARHFVDEVIQEHQGKDRNGSLILVDIDQFKQVNDTYGHQIGDKILKQVCTIIKNSIRKTDFAARWGGEELAVYLPGADLYNGFQIAEAIRLRVATNTDPAVTVSCGIADWNHNELTKSVENLFYKADMALYCAKNSGRNRSEMASIV